MSCEVAEALVKNETLTSSHMQSLADNPVDASPNTNNSSVPSINNRLNLLDALACMIKLSEVKRATLAKESNISLNGRPCIALTLMAQEVLYLVFNESKSSVHGMGK